MAITIDFGQLIISINKVDMVLAQSVPSEIYTLDMNTFRQALNALEDNEEGMMFPDTHTHNPPLTISGAVLARTVEIINDYTVTFEDGQYRVNVVGANTNIGERINVNQVSVSTSNSAGLQDLESLQAASFGGEVTVDVTSGFGGVSFPVGTRRTPVNNMVSATIIAAAQGLSIIHIVGNLTLSTGDDARGFTIQGENQSSTFLTIETGALVGNCTFRDMHLQGTLDYNNEARDCSIGNLLNNNGYMIRCAFHGTITLGGGIKAHYIDCYSGVAGDAKPTLDFGGSGQQLVMRGYKGGLIVKNKTSTDAASIDMDSGNIILESTISAGKISIRGMGVHTDNSTGTAEINTDALLNKAGIGSEVGAMSVGQFIALK